MKLSQLSTKPQLTLITLDDEEIIKEFGEALEFYTWDRQPIEVFMKLANTSQNNITQMIEVVRTLLLDENGKEIITDGNILPSNVLVKAISKVVDTLGK
jgi:hypothetical protein